MATYFNGNSDIQGDGLQTLILMNPSYVGYSDTQHQQPTGNFVFLNSAAAAATGNSLHPQNLLHAPPNQLQHLVGIPLQGATHNPHPPSVHPQQQILAHHGFAPRLRHMYSSIEPTAARELTCFQQGLSLSLSSRDHIQATEQTVSPTTGDDLRVSGGTQSAVASGISNSVSGVQSVLLSSKYLKAAQELLDEAVNVGKVVQNESARGTMRQSNTTRDSPTVVAVAGEGGETSAKHGGELTTVERQEVQMKKAKLINILEEVEQRYRQYQQQMQGVISWFEQASGIGSAKPYTALALQTISKQFRSLKDAITGQIRTANKSLGEEDCEGKNEVSRLKFVDHHLRQQRALQQLGMIQPNAWRPQRGLPERSVSVLRAWLFEHFLHPYPKDSDKVMLAKQTGLTRSQVSNWFINARVRLWKPMVEEMYLEEIKQQEKNRTEDKTSKSESKEEMASNSNPAHRKSPASENQNSTFMSKQDNPSAVSVSAASPSPNEANTQSQPGFSLIWSPEIEPISQGSPKKQRSSEIFHVPLKFGDDRPVGDGFTLMGGPANFTGGFGSYPIGEIGRFSAEQFAPAYSGNAVSLSLALPQCDNLSVSGTHHSFLPNPSIQMGRRLEIGDGNEFGVINTTSSSQSTDVYENINIQNRKRFAAQLLQDFVT